MSQNWRQRCQATGVAPDLVERIASRYQAYAAHTANRPGALQLGEWFKWYAVENRSQMSADQVQVDGCSVAGDAAPSGRVDRSADILDLVKLRLDE